jgi:hypothetical protein
MMDYFDNSDINHDTFYSILEETLNKCQATHGKVKVTQEKTTHVIDGRLFTVRSSHADGSPFLEAKFWVGVNDRRLFYITYLEKDAKECEEVFKFCFGGAEKAGWSLNYENIVGFTNLTTSVWATCLCPEYLMERPRPNMPEELTRAGRFWAVDISMMVQSQLRTMERHGVRCSTATPEPL